MITPRAYAEAFAVGRVSDVAIEKMVRVIRKNGDWSRREKIVAAIEAAARAHAGKSLVIVESARPLTAAQRAMIETRFPTQQFDQEYRTNPEVVAGVRIEINRESQIDATLASAIRKMFHKP